MSDQKKGKIAYILKGFPRISETFIANEIRLMEEYGQKLSLFSVKQGDSQCIESLMQGIRTPVTYLPQVDSMSGTPLPVWIRRNIRPFLVDQGFLIRKQPLRYIKTLYFSLNCAWKYRQASTRSLKNTFIKEFLFATRIARELLTQETCSLIHAHFCHDATNIAWMASQLTGISFSFTAHAKDIYQKKLNPGDLLQRKLAATRFVVTCTGANGKYLRDLCEEPEKISKIYHGLDLELFSMQDSAKSQGTPLILSVGRMVEKKGFTYLVQACKQLRDAGVSFRCIIIGEPGLCSEPLQQEIHQNRLDGVIEIRNPLPQLALKALYQEAALFTLPCIVLEDGDRDGIPNVLAEAMAMGIPVVTTGISGIPEIIKHGREGLLVEPRDAADLADALRRLLENEELCRVLGRNGRLKIEDCFNARETHLELKALFDREMKSAVTA